MRYFDSSNKVQQVKFRSKATNISLLKLVI